MRFNRDFYTIEILPSYFFEEIFFKDCEFIKLLKKANLREFICNTMDIYPMPVKMFYANLRYADGSITVEVKKHPFSPFLEQLAEICNLPCFNPHYLEINQSEDLIIVVSLSFLYNLDSSIPSPFLVGSVCLDIHLINYVVKHILVPKKKNLIQLSKDDVVMTQSLANRFEKDRASVLNFLEKVS